MFGVNRVIGRKGRFRFNQAIMDSSAFKNIELGKGHMDVRRYALYADDVSENGQLDAVVSQDYMCEPFILRLAKKWGFSNGTVKHHQQLTIERYVDLCHWVQSGTYVMPVLQGYEPSEYLEHIDMYGDLLKPGMWIGVGSVCRRNGHPEEALAVFRAIKEAQPNNDHHAFGIKKTTLQQRESISLIDSADSLAKSLQERWRKWATGQGNSNDPHAALQYAREIDEIVRTHAAMNMLVGE